ncbi:MAG TPA: universal stress protein [Pseudolabrys sp.]|nr:universal stress protein [Pseudolabrys sp.]
MSMKTILVPMDNHDMRSALETALLLGQRNKSYIEGFALRWQVIELVAGIDAMGGVPLDNFKEDVEEEAKKAKQVFEIFMKEHDVPRSSETTESVSFGWLDHAAEREDFIGNYGRVFDVIVMNRRDANSGPMHDRAIESGLFESGRPILLSPPSPPDQIATNVLIAWNCSTEQARATALAMPILQKADRVTILTVIGGTGVPGPSAEQLIRYLRCNGVVAESMRVELDGRSTGEVILASAQSLGCDLLIKGAYTQSRLRQWIFGGATQHVLANAALPVLLAN